MKRNSKANNNHGRGFGNGTLFNQARRRVEADKRNEERAERSPKQQLAKLDEGGFAAKRERARLTTLIKPRKTK